MSLINVFLLLFLALLWGSSFVLMKFLAPVFGPFITADMRLLIGGSVLVFAFLVFRHPMHIKRFWKKYLFIGLLNSGVPFILYSFAALNIPGSVSSVVNSLTPVFGAVFAAVWLNDTLTLRKITGLTAGVGGVVIVSMGGTFPINTITILSLLACLAATVCYGLAGTYIKKNSSGMSPMAMAGASQFFAGIFLLPLVLTGPAQPEGINVFSLSILVLFAVMCSSLAYLVYFHLISSEGPSKTLTVTFLIPLFGVSGSSLLLGETITPVMILGFLVILSGTLLVVTGKKKVSVPVKLVERE